MSELVSLDDKVRIKEIESSIVENEYLYLRSAQGLRDMQIELQTFVDSLFEKYGIKKEEFKFNLSTLEFVPCESVSSQP